MAASPRPVIETRYDQMFSSLEPAEIDACAASTTRGRTARANVCWRPAKFSPGMFMILTGEVTVTQHNAHRASP